MKKRSKMWLKKLKNKFGKKPPDFERRNHSFKKSILFIFSPLVF